MTFSSRHRAVRIFVRSFLLAIVICLCVTVPGWCCPECKKNLAFQAGDLEFGFAASILLMLGAPLGILIGWTTWIRRHFRVVRPNFGMNG
jgi:hypothetical protein